MKAVARGQAQTKLIERAKRAPGGFIAPANDAERKALEDLEKQGMAWQSVAWPGMWSINLVNGR